MDVDETQKIDDLSVIDQIKSKNGHEFINDQEKKYFLKFVKTLTNVSEEYRKHYKDVYSLKTGLNSIGRADTCDIVIPSPNLSKLHAFIEINSNGMFIWDNTTTNKTKKNNVELKPTIHYELKHDDSLILGNIQLTFSHENCGAEKGETNGDNNHLNIQNTLEDDIMNSKAIVNNNNNGMVIDDTDDEEEEEKKVDTPFNDTIIFDNTENEVIPETQEIVTNGGGGEVHESVINETLPVVDSVLVEEGGEEVEQQNVVVVSKSSSDKIEDIVSSKEEVEIEKKEETVAQVEEEEEQMATNTEAIEENKPIEATKSEEKIEPEPVVEEKKIETEVIVESTLLDETKEKNDDEQNQTQIDADMTVDENTIDQTKVEEKPKRTRKKKEDVQVTETQTEEKRPVRGSRRSTAPPVAEPVQVKTSGRGRKSKKADAEKLDKEGDDNVEATISTETGEENKVESTEVTNVEEKKVELAENESKEEESNVQEAQPVKAKGVRGRKSVAKKVEEKEATPPKRRGRKQTIKNIDEGSNAETVETTAKSDDTATTSKADVYDHSETEETMPKKGKNTKVEKEEEPVKEKKKRVGRKKKEIEPDAEDDDEATNKKLKNEEEEEQKIVSTPQQTVNKNLFFQRSATKQIPVSSSSNTVSNLDITGVSEVGTKSEETPRKKIKLTVSSSDESDSEMATSTKRLKSNFEDVPIINRSLTITPKKSVATKAPKAATSAKKRASKSSKADNSISVSANESVNLAKTTTGSKRKKNKSPSNLNVSEELNMTTATATTTNDGETSINEVSRVSASSKKATRVIKPIRQSLNDSASTRHSSRSTKTGNLVKVLTTGIVLSDRDQQIVQALGGQMATDPKENTHLIANKIIKSCKFLSSVNRGIPVITERWLDESIRARMFLNLASFKLQDPDTEKQLKFSLERSIEKAKTKPLLKLWKFYIDQTDFDKSDFTLNEIKIMIESAQGEVVDKLTDNEEELIDYCMIFVNEETLKNYNGIGASDETLLLRMTIDDLTTCLLTQKYPLN